MEAKQLLTAVINNDIRQFKSQMETLVDNKIVEKIAAIKQRTLVDLGLKLVNEQIADCASECQSDRRQVVRARRARRHTLALENANADSCDERSSDREHDQSNDQSNQD